MFTIARAFSVSRGTETYHAFPPSTAKLIPTNFALTASVEVVSESNATVEKVKISSHNFFASSSLSTRKYSWLTSFKRLWFVSFKPLGRSSVSKSKRGPRLLEVFNSFSRSSSSIFLMNCRNSKFSKMGRRRFLSACVLSSCFRSREMGTSVLIVTRNLEKRICSAFSSTFFFSAPFSSEVVSRR